MKNRGFTIVELLVVIVVIGILAAITIISYTGISKKAEISSLQSDLTNGSKKLKMYQVEYGSFPQDMTSTDGNVTYCPTGTNPDPKYCIKPSSNTTFEYSNLGNTTSPQGFGLMATKNSTSYIISGNSTPAVISATPNLSCPTGFIPVPGSITYGQADFCVMKYEAKDAGGNVPVSQAAGTPWASVSQTNAARYSQNVVGCTGCHLITESEWLTIAQNILKVTSNWRDNFVGTSVSSTNYIYSGHNDNAPANALAADSNDTNGYYGETNTGGNQRRTLTLSNGEVIWDLAGNVREWTSGNSNSGFPGVTSGGFTFREWTSVTNPGTLTPNVFPSITGISNASTWTSTNGIGQILSSSNYVGPIGFIRGGNWAEDNWTGVLYMFLGWNSSSAEYDIGFRVSR